MRLRCEIAAEKCQSSGVDTISQVDHDSYHRMLEQYKAAKEQQGSNELKIKQ